MLEKYVIELMFKLPVMKLMRGGAKDPHAHPSTIPVTIFFLMCCFTAPLFQ